MEIVKVLSDIVTAVLANWEMVLIALIGLISALIGLFLAIPGAEPEASLQKAVDFLAKFSKKPKSE
jgi:hypothetical protein